MSRVRLERAEDVGVIVIDNPPINAGSTEVRQGLIEAIERIEAADDLKAAVIIGAGATFIAGSDIREFGGPLEQPELPQVILAIENSRKPYVAALHGSALGGGYELALGCDFRVATETAVVGLPEVTLGMIPGAGGTQRLPRLVGPERALSLICSGERISAPEAKALGMIDEIVEGDLRSEAVVFARSRTGKSRIRDRAMPGSDPAALDAAAAVALKRGRRRPQVSAAIQAVRNTVSLPFDEALKAEREIFTRLRLAPEAAALRHIFFAERRAGRPPKGAIPRRLARFGVIGAGTMGAGIAAALLRGGLSVRLVDQAPAALERAKVQISKAVDQWVERGEISAAEGQAMQDRLSLEHAIETVADCDGVVEAIIEKEEAKVDLLRALSGIVREDALLATNTSYLDIDSLSDAVDLPERFVGLHFFNPAHIMRLVEVVRAKATSDAALATAIGLARRMDKLPVVARPGFGFIGNRIYAAYRRECEFMVEEGAWPEEVDQALQQFGFALGPFATGDLSGLDIAWAMRKATAASRDPRAPYPSVADRLCELGRYGRKTGSGWYRYEPGARNGTADPEVRDIIIEESARKGIARRAFTAAEIVKRVLGVMVREAAALLSEGIAERASDIDVVLVNGFGFPRHEGGPLWWASADDRRERMVSTAMQSNADEGRAVASMLAQVRSD